MHQKPSIMKPKKELKKKRVKKEIIDKIKTEMPLRAAKVMQRGGGVRL